MNRKQCECGCGLDAPIATHTNNKSGAKKGFPQRFAVGHNRTRWDSPTTIRSHGYISIKIHGHPMAGAGSYVYEHLLVAEHALGRALPPDVEVHHVNEIKSDNRPENLVIYQDAAYHLLLHSRAKAYKATGYADAVKCIYCHQWGRTEQDNMHTVKRSDNRHGHSYHRACIPK